jgi:hypothetical protein
VIEELLRELYHSLRFSNEETSSSHDEDDAKIHDKENIDMVPKKRKKSKASEAINSKTKGIKSYTFEKSHMKL